MTTTVFWEDNNPQRLLIRLLLLVLTWVIVWLVVRYIGQWVLRLILRAQGFAEDPGGFTIMRRFLRSIAILLGIITSLAILGMTPMLVSTLTTVGVVSIVVGLAIRDVAANFISGVLLLFDQPFSVGDMVAAANVQGRVESITLRSTRIRTLEGPLVTVPNSVIAANAITNFTLSPNRRIELTWKVPLARGLTTEEASAALLNVVVGEPRVLLEPPPHVLLGDVREDSFDLKLIYHIHAEDWPEVESAVKEAMVTRLLAQPANTQAAAVTEQQRNE
jgi:small-conductance mechanosensitive channel